MAYVLTPAILLLPNLYYSFKGTPVTLGTFFKAVRTPCLASLAMAAGLLVFRSIAPGMGLIASIGSGCVIGGTIYLLVLLCLPGGTMELKAVFADVMTSLPGADKSMGSVAGTGVVAPDPSSPVVSVNPGSN